jgi:hypothetical protein
MSRIRIPRKKKKRLRKLFEAGYKELILDRARLMMFEEISRDCELVCQAFGIPSQTLKRLNETQNH